MIRTIVSANLNTQAYDACIEADPLQLPYAHSWYLNTVSENWEVLVLNDYEAVWPLPYREKYGQKYYYRPYAVQQLGIFSRRKLRDVEWGKMLDAFCENVRFAEVYLNEGQVPSMQSKSYLSLKPQANYTLDLQRPYSAIYRDYRTNLKRKLKKLDRSALSLYRHDGPDLLINLFKETKAKQLSLKEDFFRNFERVMYMALHKGLGKVYSVYTGPNRLVAGAFFIEYQRRSIFLFSATDDLGKETGAMNYLLDEYIIYASEKQSILDFEGSNAEGLAYFYSSFGAQLEIYHQLKYNRLPWPISWLKK